MKKLNEEFDSSLHQDMIAQMYGKVILEETDRLLVIGTETLFNLYI